MMRIACLGLRPLLHRDRQMLSFADRLALEEHISDCDACRADVSLVVAMRTLMDSMPDSMPARSSGTRRYNQAIERAFAAAGSAQPLGAVTARPTRALALAGAALCVAAALGLYLARGSAQDSARPATRSADREAARSAPPRHTQPLRNNQPASGTRPGLRDPSPGRVTEGALAVERTVDHSMLLPGHVIPAGVVLHAEQATTIQVDAATIVASQHSALRWDPQHTTMHLVDGQVDVEVDPRASRTFHVSAPGFIVEVTGTRFRVSPAFVSVARGSVRILGHDGRVMASHLGAGDEWQVEPGDVAADTPRRGQPAANPDDMLAQARRAFIAGDIARTRQLAAGALRAEPSRSRASDARTLLAECAQASGQPAEAARLYLDVARRYADLPAGETALFAAARLFANSGHKHRAQALFRRYLDTFPNGRFASDATARLRAAGPESAN